MSQEINKCMEELNGTINQAGLITIARTFYTTKAQYTFLHIWIIHKDRPYAKPLKKTSVKIKGSKVYKEWSNHNQDKVRTQYQVEIREIYKYIEIK